MTLDPDLLRILVCPACKKALAYRPERGVLSCGACRKDYPVKGDIPVLLVEEGKPCPEAP